MWRLMPLEGLIISKVVRPFKQTLAYIVSSNTRCEFDIIQMKLLANVAVCLGENPKEVFGKEKNCDGTPMIKVEQQTSVLWLDNEVFMSVSPRYAAIIWVSAFLFFNAEVPSYIKKTFSLLQYLFFKTPKNFVAHNQAAAEVLVLYSPITSA